MSKASRYLSICANVLRAAMGSGPGRRVNREELEQSIGKRWTAFAMSLPVVLLVVWLSVWVAARIAPQDNAPASDPPPIFEMPKTN